MPGREQIRKNFAVANIFINKLILALQKCTESQVCHFKFFKKFVRASLGLRGLRLVYKATRFL